MAEKNEQYAEHWGREGFYGDGVNVIRSARHRRRPPIHYNADYDEVILYFSGPGAWGGVKDPGTLTWVPKGIAHHGPSEDVAEGYHAWMLESRSTLRLTEAGLKVAHLMELDMYGPHPSSGGAVV